MYEAYVIREMYYGIVFSTRIVISEPLIHTISDILIKKCCVQRSRSFTTLRKYKYVTKERAYRPANRYIYRPISLIFELKYF